MAKEKAKYFHFEPAAFMSDVDFISMTAAERGCYCSLLFALYCNDGKIENDPVTLAKICNVNLNFDFTFILKKFTKKNKHLTHKRVSEVMKNTQAIRKQRVKAANARWKNTDANAMHMQCKSNAKRSEAKAKQSKENITYSNTRKTYDLFSHTLREKPQIETDRIKINQNFKLMLDDILGSLKRSDRTCRDNITNWIGLEVENGNFTTEIYGRILGYAMEAQKTADNPWAFFIETLKREFDYQSKINEIKTEFKNARTQNG